MMLLGSDKIQIGKFLFIPISLLRFSLPRLGNLAEPFSIFLSKKLSTKRDQHRSHGTELLRQTLIFKCEMLFRPLQERIILEQRHISLYILILVLQDKGKGYTGTVGKFLSLFIHLFEKNVLRKNLILLVLGFIPLHSS